MTVDNSSTTPDSWADMPGTRTQKHGKEHPNSTEQEYHLQDETEPVKKGTHERKTMRAEPANVDNLMPKNTGGA